MHRFWYQSLRSGQRHAQSWNGDYVDYRRRQQLGPRCRSRRRRSQLWRGCRKLLSNRCGRRMEHRSQLVQLGRGGLLRVHPGGVESSHLQCQPKRNHHARSCYHDRQHRYDGLQWDAGYDRVKLGPRDQRRVPHSRHVQRPQFHCQCDRQREHLDCGDGRPPRRIDVDDQR